MSPQDIIDRVHKRALNAKTRTDQTDVYVPRIRSTLSVGDLRDMEARFDLDIPPILHRIYSEIGDGGFGPGYGFLPMLEPESKYDDSVLNLYTLFRGGDPDDPKWQWPEALLPIVDFGCAIRACIDCQSEDVIVHDPNLSEPGVGCNREFLHQHCKLTEWLCAWCDGENLWESIYV